MQTYLIIPGQDKKGSSKTYAKSSIGKALSGAFAKPVLKRRAKMGEVLIARAVEYIRGCGFPRLQEGSGPFQPFLFEPIASRLFKDIDEASFKIQYSRVAA